MLTGRVGELGALQHPLRDLRRAVPADERAPLQVLVQRQHRVGLVRRPPVPLELVDPVGLHVRHHVAALGREVRVAERDAVVAELGEGRRVPVAQQDVPVGQLLQRALGLGVEVVRVDVLGHDPRRHVPLVELDPEAPRGPGVAVEVVDAVVEDGDGLLVGRPARVVLELEVGGVAPGQVLEHVHLAAQDPEHLAAPPVDVRQAVHVPARHQVVAPRVLVDAVQVEVVPPHAVDALVVVRVRGPQRVEHHGPPLEEEVPRLDVDLLDHAVPHRPLVVLPDFAEVAVVELVHRQ